jgi:hypothetical protein
LVGKEKSKSSKDVHKSKKDNLEISKSMTKDFLDLLKQIEDEQSKIIKSSK